MRFTVKLPRLGELVDTVVVLAWLCAEGDPVAEGDPLILVETDKVEMDVPSPVAGQLVSRLVSVDDEISTGTPFAVVVSVPPEASG